MDGILIFFGYALILFAVSIVGAYLPYLKKLSDEQTHLLIALSAGIFLGLLFLMLIPEAFELSVEHEGHDFKDVSILLLIGFLVIALVDTLIKYYHMTGCPCECHEEQHQHEMSSISAFIGLAVHSTCDGLALAASLLGGEEVGFVALIGMCIHKLVVLFSLSSSFLLTDATAKQRWTYLIIFSLITPISGVLFFAFFDGLDVHNVAGLPMAFAAGTFMFVTFCNMMPEAFHREHNRMKSFIVILVGVAIAAISMILVNAMGGHVH